MPTHHQLLLSTIELSPSAQVYAEAQESQIRSQREIERRTGVPQSTISAQRSYLVKSVKLLVEDYDGKFGLAKDADPSWWRKEGVLDGLPKPKQVWAWWRAELILQTQERRVAPITLPRIPQIALVAG